MEGGFERLRRRLQEEPMTEGELADLSPVAQDWGDGSRFGLSQPAPGGARPRPTRPTVEVSRAGSGGPVPSFRELAPAAPVEDLGAPDLGQAAAPEPIGDVDFTAAQDEGRNRTLGVALGRAGAQINEAISGAKYDRGAYDAMESQTGNPVRELLARREADRKKALEDPTSEQSRRFQQAVSKALGSVYTPDEIAQMTAADEPSVTRYGEMRQRLDERKAALSMRQEEISREEARRLDDRAWQEKQTRSGRAASAAEAEKQRAFEREKWAANNAADLEQAAVRAKLGPDGQPLTRGTVIHGLEIEPGAAPTAEDAKKVKQALVAGDRMRRYVAQLRDLHSKYGTEYGGEAGTTMAQLAKAIQIEGKTIAELGALSGPDQQLMEDLAGADPSSLGANVRGLLTGGVMDNTQAALGQLEKWVGDAEGAAKKVYGYRDAAGQQPAPAPTGTVRLINPDDGKAYDVDAAEAAEAEANGWRRG